MAAVRAQRRWAQGPPHGAVHRSCIEQSLNRADEIPGVAVPTVSGAENGPGERAPGYSRDFNSSAGWKRRISRAISALPLKPAQCSAVAPMSPGVFTGQPASNIKRTALVLLLCAASGSLACSGSDSAPAGSGCWERKSSQQRLRRPVRRPGPASGLPGCVA